MSDFDFVDDVVNDVDPNERPGFVELPAGWHEKVCEVIDIERVKTSAEDGEMVKVTVRIAEKKYASNRAWGRYFIKTDNPDKVKGAKIGASEYLKLINACGFVLPKAMKDEKVAKAVQVGLLEEFDKNTFKDSKLIGKFFKGNILVADRHPDNPDQPIYPELKGAKLIDVDQFEDVIKAAKETKKDKVSKPETDEPPF